MEHNYDKRMSNDFHLEHRQLESFQFTDQTSTQLVCVLKSIHTESELSQFCLNYDLKIVPYLVSDIIKFIIA